MKRIPTGLDEVILLEPKQFHDDRGYFLESYHQEKLLEFGLNIQFVQDNQSYSSKAHTVRGLHYQLAPKAQSKLVRVVRGAIYDVAVDIRPSSPTFGHWTGAILSEFNQRQLFIPAGYAHGFCTLVEDTVVAYKVDAVYSPVHDRGIRWDDPAIGIMWPTSSAVLSDKDAKLPRLHEAELGD